MNRNYIFGESSLKHLFTTNQSMIDLAYRAMLIANTRKLHCPDWGITSGKRTSQEQFSLFLSGRVQNQNNFKWEVVDPKKVVTNCDGKQIRSSHQSGNAIDIYVVGDDHYDPAQLALVATCFFEAADELGLRIDWGGSYKSISDAPHIEIIN